MIGVEDNTLLCLIEREREREVSLDGRSRCWDRPDSLVFWEYSGVDLFLILMH